MWACPECASGFRLRAVGLNPDAARYGGMPVKRSIVLALTFSGALAGLAGALLVFGSESHRFVTDGSAAGFTGSAGFNGIVTALFGALHPLWTIPSSFLFGGLLVGANSLQRAVQVPQALIVALNGLVVRLTINGRGVGAPQPLAVSSVAPGDTAVVYSAGEIWSESITEWSYRATLSGPNGESYENTVSWK